MSTTSTSVSLREFSNEEKWASRKMMDVATISKVSVTFDNEWGAALIDAAQGSPNEVGMGLEEYVLNAVKMAIIDDGYGPERYVGCNFSDNIEEDDAR